MTTKMGRPKSENPKSERITVRLDRQRAEKLNAYCKKRGIDKAEGIRRGIDKLEDAE